MAILNSRIILAKNIKLDKSYKNILTYTESDMVSLCETNAVYQSNTYSFIKIGENQIIVGASYGTCLSANYIAFQNPHYSNKWFFAFIDSVEYNAESSTIINYTIDVCSTWRDYWNPKACFVIREHVNSDGYHEHLVPEDFETGDYIVGYQSDFSEIGTCHPVMGTTYDPNSNPTGNVGGGTYGGIFSGVTYYVFRDTTALISAINRLQNGHADAIESIFLLPDWITGYNSASWSSDGISLVPKSTMVSSSTGIAIPLQPLTIDGYTPKNKKLFNAPYMVYVLSNNGGGSAVYKLEDFYDDGGHTGSINVYGTCTPGGSVRAIPENYKSTSNVLSQGENNEYGLNLAKFPICSWQSDVYTNWLTQNGINIGGLKLNQQEASIGAGVIGIVAGGALLATGVGGVAGGALLTGGIGSIAGSVKANYQHALQPPQAEGNINSGDVTYTMNKITFTGYFMTIRAEFARIIDDYFSVRGYKINRIKVPNQTGRQNWNYVQIAEEEEIGYPDNANRIPVPAEAMEVINQVYRKGVTCWHSHDNLGNYALSNNIV